ncbi:FlgN protein [Caldicellulosiruptor bescii]|uniref:FlgN family protein n=2 Tax=Caldicellulosiruptor bescii TaxID=31899 RepID=B9MKB2_CALBD|nr:flagellar protein FlgN [Caldicellulosiruptor bescii]ACM60770.1 FlgN family protein [Caldicellulosiruptor bescii DSM 6725]PBC89413.1 FlgN protein [Caldicellulosiruptor bescii]PBC91102.1 FlgN protein [Caldicellulosiruptor bescii]PBD03484.1 FlgN protein [Caldicellulosiruptor bescii]PBD06901.1 FlgN protein [Caldicellulosiruptor bescii]
MNYVEKIIELLEEEYKVFERILNLSNEKTKYIVENNLSALIEVSNQEKKETEIIEKLERERQEILNALSKEKNIAIVNLNELVNIATPDEWQRINDLKVKLGEIIFKLKKTNDLNASLVSSALEYIDFMTNVISSYFSDNTTYQKDGQTGSQKKNLFDVKL